MTTNKLKALAIASAVTSFVAGGALGYVIANKRLARNYEAMLAEDTAAIKDAYHQMANKTGVFSTPEGAVEALIVGGGLAGLDPDSAEYREVLTRRGKEAFASYIAGDLTEAIQETVVEVLDRDPVNVFDRAAADAELDSEGVPWDAGLPDRESDRPYIISMEEFMDSENDQITITYYRGDNSLCDEREVLIDDVDNLVGYAHLSQFGRGSKDENIVYVRNEVISTDFEIVLDEGKYSVEVLGVTPDEAETKPTPRKRKPKASERDD